MAHLILIINLKTGIIKATASAKEIQDALNDIPYLNQNLVTVSENIDFDSNETLIRNFTIEFPASLGDVSELEVIGNVSWSIKEITKGVSTNAIVQVSIEGRNSAPFDLRDKASSVNKKYII